MRQPVGNLTFRLKMGIEQLPLSMESLLSFQAVGLVISLDIPDSSTTPSDLTMGLPVFLPKSVEKSTLFLMKSPDLRAFESGGCFWLHVFRHGRPHSQVSDIVFRCVQLDRTARVLNYPIFGCWFGTCSIIPFSNNDPI